MFVGVLLLIVTLPSFSLACGAGGDYDVVNFGAIGDGLTENSQAFLDAWNAACSDCTENPRVIIPENQTFLVNPVMFTGPCQSRNINFMISGTIVAPGSTSIWDGKDASQWLGFKNVDGLVVDGFGTIDGQGKCWWDQSCRYHPKLENCTKLAPTAMKILSCSGTSVSGLTFFSSAQTHLLVKGSTNVLIDNVKIQSPGNSPNTDGIHIHASSQVIVNNSNIACGDDCISIGDHIFDIQINNIQCGPGHGISIGSLGKGGSYVQVEKIRVSNSFVTGTTNGARIKTWQEGQGYVRDVIFENLMFDNVQNPIIIDQNYCDVRGACPEKETGVQISNVMYKGLLGTSSTDIAINLNCSRSHPCFDITMDSVKLVPNENGKEVTANCSDAHGQEDDVIPGPCLAQ